MTQPYGNILYRFALDENNSLVDILDLTESNRHIHSYKCPNCKDKMIPVMGDKRQWHFRHDSGTVCDGETYLHRLGKIFFLSRFKQDKPLYIIIKYEAQCPKYNACPFAKFAENQCIKEITKKVNLKALYDTIADEKKLDKWTPDILLTNSKHAHLPFFVEIWVTHRCEEDKLTSGYPIYEIHIEGLEDAINIKRNATLIGEYHLHTDTIKAASKQLVMQCHAHCYRLYKSGKSWSGLVDPNCCNFIPLKKDNIVIDFCLPCRDYRTSYDINSYMNEVVNLGINMKDCRLCLNYLNFHSIDDTNVCEIHRRGLTPATTDTRSAYACDYYTKRLNIQGLAERPIIRVFQKELLDEEFIKHTVVNEIATAKAEKEKRIKREQQQEEERKIKVREALIQSKLSLFEDAFNKGQLKLSIAEVDTSSPKSLTKWTFYDIKNTYEKCRKQLDTNSNCRYIEFYSEHLQIDKLFLYILIDGEKIPELIDKSRMTIFMKMASYKMYGYEINLTNIISINVPQMAQLYNKEKMCAVLKRIKP